jgi:hypothetical protein
MPKKSSFQPTSEAVNLNSVNVWASKGLMAITVINARVLIKEKIILSYSALYI